MASFCKTFLGITTFKCILAISVSLSIHSCSQGKKPNNSNIPEKSKFDSLYIDMLKRDSLYHVNNKSAALHAIDTLTHYVAKYLLYGNIGCIDDSRTKFIFICRIDQTGEIKEVYIQDSIPHSYNDSVLINYLLSMPKFEKWKEINPSKDRELYTDIIVPLRIRY